MASERGFRVVRAGAADVEDFLRLRSALFQEVGHTTQPILGSALEAPTRERFARGVGSGALCVWIARAEGGEALGTIAMHVRELLPTPANPRGDEGYVVSVYTRPAWRRRGVGAALLQDLLVEARRLGLGRLRLHTSSAGRPLYRRFGFEEHADNLQLVLAEPRR